MRLALNIVTDITLDYAIKVSEEAVRFGAESIWIGETQNVPHPFTYLLPISERVKVTLGTSIISAYLNDPASVIEFSRKLLRNNIPAFIVGVGLGDIDYLKVKGVEPKNPLDFMRKYVSKLFKSLPEKASVIVGTAGRRMANLSCKITGAVLLNFVHPDYIKWVKRGIEVKCEINVIGPALLKTFDSRLIRALRIASAIVLKGMNEKFLRNFGFESLAEDIKKILSSGDYWKLGRYDNVLLDKFAIYGDIVDFETRIEELSKLNVNRLILGPPIYRDRNLIEKVFSKLRKY